MQDSNLTESDRRVTGPRIIAFGLAAFFAVYWAVYGYGFADRHFVDAKSFWLAAQMAFEQGVSPYTSDFKTFAEQTPGGYAHPFVYPPPSLLLLLPIEALDYRGATLALLAMSHAAIVAIALGFAIAAWGGLRPPTLRAALLFVTVVVLVAMAQASRITLGIGQVNLIASAGLIWFWAALLGRTSRWAGATGLIVLALLKPYFAVVGLLILVPAGRHLLAPVMVLSLATLVASITILPGSVWPDWIGTYLLSLGRDGLYLGTFDYASANNVNLSRALARTLGSEIPSLVTTGLFFCALALQAIAIARHHDDAKNLTGPAMALMLFAFLFAPFSYEYYLVFCVSAAAMNALVSSARGAVYSAGLSVALLLALLQPSHLAIGPAGPDMATFAVAGFWFLTLLSALPRPLETV